MLTEKHCQQGVERVESVDSSPVDLEQTLLLRVRMALQ